jgi:hypothetical protein
MRLARGRKAARSAPSRAETIASTIGDVDADRGSRHGRIAAADRVESASPRCIFSHHRLRTDETAPPSPGTCPDGSPSPSPDRPHQSDRCPSSCTSGNTSHRAPPSSYSSTRYSLRSSSSPARPACNSANRTVSFRSNQSCCHSSYSPSPSYRRWSGRPRTTRCCSTRGHLRQAPRQPSHPHLWPIVRRQEHRGRSGHRSRGRTRGAPSEAPCGISSRFRPPCSKRSSIPGGAGRDMDTLMLGRSPSSASSRSTNSTRRSSWSRSPSTTGRPEDVLEHVLPLHATRGAPDVTRADPVAPCERMRRDGVTIVNEPAEHLGDLVFFCRDPASGPWSVSAPRETNGNLEVQDPDSGRRVADGVAGGQPSARSGRAAALMPKSERPAITPNAHHRKLPPELVGCLERRVPPAFLPTPVLVPRSRPWRSHLPSSIPARMRHAVCRRSMSFGKTPGLFFVTTLGDKREEQALHCVSRRHSRARPALHHYDNLSPCADSVLFRCPTSGSGRKCRTAPPLLFGPEWWRSLGDESCNPRPTFLRRRDASLPVGLASASRVVRPTARPRRLPPHADVPPSRHRRG